MNDQLKIFTSEHREEFDLYEPSPMLWDKIETRMQEAPIKRMRTVRLRVMQAVAAAAIIAGAWFGIRAMNSPVKKEAPALAKEQTPVQPQPVQQEIPQTVPQQALPEQQTPALVATGTPKTNPVKLNSTPRIAPATVPEADQLSAYAVNKRDVRNVNNYLKKNVPEMHNRFSEDLSALQKQYVELERSLKTGVNSDQILAAMKTNLEMQHELVNRQLNAIKEIKKIKQPRNENLPTT